MTLPLRRLAKHVQDASYRQLGVRRSPHVSTLQSPPCNHSFFVGCSGAMSLTYSQAVSASSRWELALVEEARTKLSIRHEIVFQRLAGLVVVISGPYLNSGKNQQRVA